MRAPADDGHHPAREPTQPDLPELLTVEHAVTGDKETPERDRRRLVIHAACTCRGVANGFANVVVSKIDGRIDFDPHVTGACVLTFREDEACVLRDALTRWLG